MNPVFNIRRCLVRLMLALGLLAAGGQVFAANCTFTHDLVRIALGNVTVPRDAPVGAAIGSVLNANLHVHCQVNPSAPSPSSTAYYLQIIPSLAMSPVPNVWATGMDGIGIRAVNVTSNLIWSSSSAKSDFAPPVPGGTSVYDATFVIQYQLVKTAAQVTAGGPLNVSQMFYLNSHDVPANTDSGAQQSRGIGGTTITTATCSVTTNPVNVTLPPLPANQLTPVGATGGDTGFQIELQCGAGANVYVTLTDAADAGNTTDQLTLAGGSSASGVKLRILDADGAPVNFGPDSAAPGNPGQWLVGDSASLSGIPLTVQYIATGVAKPGTVQGTATFTLSYQ